MTTVLADSPETGPAYDISWPQCPATFPEGAFSFAIIGLNNGRPFTTNDCFTDQYAWARGPEAHPDVYINLDFPRPGRKEAKTGPYGKCAETDDWCRAHNYGYALAKDSVARAARLGVTPRRYWLDVELANHWSDWPPNNGQVVRGVLDYFLDFNIPVGIYGTRYQWNLITGSFVAPGKLPLWVAGAEDADEARGRCGDRSYTFAGGETWMVQYPEGPFDGNVLCPVGAQHAFEVAQATASQPAPWRAAPTPATAASTASPTAGPSTTLERSASGDRQNLWWTGRVAGLASNVGDD